MVMRSPAYMAKGSSSVAPSGYAGVGAAGDTSASTFNSAAFISSLTSVRTYPHTRV